ncbi:hypothetical protein Gotur_034011 [Gossypium turneri]
MEGQPWLFRKKLVIFDRLTKPMERDQIRLVSSPFWIKIGPCLPEFDKKDLLHAIRVTFGGVIRSEVNGSIKEDQETYLHSEKNSDMIQGVQEDSWLTATGTGIKMQNEGEIDEKKTERSKTDEDILKPVRKSSWKRIELAGVMKYYGAESKLQKKIGRD